MPMIKIRVGSLEGGVTTLDWNPQVLTNKVKQIAVDILHKEGQLAKDEIRSKFSKSPPSQPGNPPAVRTGKLSRGLQFRVIRGQLKLMIGVDTSVVYALAMEMGADSRNIRARPYLRPQRMRSVERIKKELKKALK